MKVRWSGVILVGLLVLGTLFLKSRTRQHGALDATKGIPSVILVADPSEANDSDDGCAVMFRAVRQAAKRGVAVAEVAPNSNSDLLRRYHVVFNDLCTSISSILRAIGCNSAISARK